jgi:hypothetical protein
VPSNLYGVANPNPAPTVAGTIGGANVNCPAATETNFCALTIPPAVSPGWYYPICFGTVAILLTATPSTFINWGARIGAGSDFSLQSTATTMLVANGVFTISLFLFGLTTLVSNPFGANTFNVTANPGTNAFSVGLNGTQFIGQWLRAPDQ